MISQVHFTNFEADESLRILANSVLSKILDRAPSDSTAVALLERQEEGYRCSLDVFSRQGPYMASVVRATAAEAIRGIEEKLEEQLSRWRTSSPVFLQVAC